MAVKATYRVELAWAQGAIGLFTFGISTFGGADRLAASSWSQTFKGTYDNITNPGDGTHVDRIQITRGREDDLSTVRAGDVTIDVSDPHGKFNAKNAASPLYGLILPNRPGRVVARYGSVDYPLAYFFTDRIEYEPGRRKGKAVIHGLDLFSRMDLQRPVLPSLGPTTTGAAFGRMLDAMSWLDPAMRRIATGIAIPDFSTNLTALGVGDSILSYTEGLLMAERGFVFIGKDGAAVYISRDQRARAFSVGSIANVMMNMVVASDIQNVTNRWTIIRTAIGGGGVSAVTVTDQASVNLYGYHDDSVSTPYLSDDNQAVNLGNYLLSRTATPLRPVWALPVRANVDAATLVQCLSRELNDRVTISEAKIGTSGDYFIEQISHDISKGGADHTTTWKLTERPGPVSPFRFGISTFGGTDLLDSY